MKAEFDGFASRYDHLLAPWLRFAGADRNYFARLDEMFVKAGAQGELDVALLAVAGDGDQV